jgi:hypothetical protein
MVGLLDIAPASRIVHGVRVTGVSVEGIISIIRRFPEIEVILGRTTADGFEARDLFALAPEAVKAVIAAGIGFPGDAEQEQAAGLLPLEVQADFLEAIITVTLPGGFGPFVERITKAAGLLQAEAPVASPATAAPANGPTGRPKATTVRVKPETPSANSLRDARASLKRGETRPL